jgi:hypothetical protein
MAQETIMTLAPEVQEIAEELIRQYHPELLECTILYRFTTAAAPCAPKKCSPEWRYAYSLHLPGCPKAAVNEGPDFRLLINQEEWDFLMPGQHEPFIDHRLLHIERSQAKDDGIRWTIKPDGFTEFPEVLQRFGLWSHAAKKIGKIIQPELDLTLPGERDDPRRGSSIKAVTLSTPGHEPVTLTDEQWEGAVRRITGEN